MKHIFTIHNHITFLSALATIEHESIAKNQVILICNNYKPPIKEDSSITLVQSYDEVEAKYNLVKKIANFNYSKGSDKYIDSISDKENFIAYIDLMSVFNRFLVTHSRCKQFHFIEEGSVNYADFDNFRMLTADLDKYHWRISYKSHFKEVSLAIYRIVRGRSLKILNLPIQPNTYAFFKGVNFYGFSKYSFPNVPKRKKRIVSFSSIKNELFVKKELDIDFTGSTIWIGDTACSFYGISMLHFEQALSSLIANVDKSKSNQVYIKYRGFESEEEKRITEKVFKNNNFIIDFIPIDAVGEYIFLNYEKLTVLGNVSSLLIYAKLMGHDVHSIFPNIPNEYDMPFAINFSSVHKLLNFTK